jgi:hypothetical protein
MIINTYDQHNKQTFHAANKTKTKMHQEHKHYQDFWHSKTYDGLQKLNDVEDANLSGYGK